MITVYGFKRVKDPVIGETRVMPEDLEVTW